jgi:hypothetical protein
MTHEEALDALHRRRQGRLDPRATQELEEHLAQCESCRGTEHAYDTLFEALRDERSHPAPDELAAYVTGYGQLSAEDNARIESHVAECASCSEEVSSSRAVERSAAAGGEAGTESPRPRAPWWAWPAAAMALVLVYPAYLGLFGKPDGTEWTGATTLQVLSSPLRDGDRLPTIARDRSSPYLLLGVRLTLPPDLPDATEIRLELTSEPANRAIAETLLPASRAREQIGSSGIVSWLLPADRVPSGSYRLRVTRADAVEPSVLLELEFRID